MVAAASLLQHGFPVEPEQIRVSLDANGEATRFYIPDEGRALPGTDTATRYAPLIWRHLQPLFATLNQQTRVASKILWSNTARRMEPLLDQAILLADEAAPIAKDREHLLRRPRWPHGQQQPINPLYSPQRSVLVTEDDRPVPMTLHRQCCLYHLLPGEDYCSACPLAPQHRKLKGAAPSA